jgi:hypothetical protein
VIHICGIGRKRCKAEFPTLAELLRHMAEKHTHRVEPYWTFYLTLAAEAEALGL